jgi:hypothetical protein
MPAHHDTPRPAWGHVTGALDLNAGPPRVDRALLPDRVLLAERMSRYGWGFDERRPDVLADCFTDDAVWEATIMGASTVGPHIGRDAILEFMTAFWPEQSDQRRHMIMNVIVEEQADADATVLAYHLLMSAATGVLKAVTSGFYRAEMRKTGGVWKIRRLLAGYDVPF